MLLRTLLNKCSYYQGFCYGKARFDGGNRIIVEIKPRKRTQGICSRCKQRGSGYDRLGKRLFEFVPMWGFCVFFEYRMRRIACRNCHQIVVESVPWADGKHHLTNTYRCFLASWAEDLSWKRVAERFHASWQKVYDSVKYVVDYGLAHRTLSNVQALGVDEVQWQKGHKYLTLVYQIDQGSRRLLWIGRKRTQETLLRFFRDMKKEDTLFASHIKVVCSDMWKAYLKVIAKKLPNAIHVLDRFHIMQKFGKAIDKVRAQEAKRLKAEGKAPILSKTRWCFLKRKGNLTKKEKFRLKDLLSINLKTVKSYLLTEQFQHFWDYNSLTWAAKFLDVWCTKAMRSRIQPMKDIAKMLRKHRSLILNWFIAKKQYNNSIVEGLNLKIKLTVRKSYGFRSFEVIQTALFHQLGKLPKPIQTHSFW